MSGGYVVRDDGVGVRDGVSDAIIYFGLVFGRRERVDGGEQLVLVGGVAVQVEAQGVQRRGEVVDPGGAAERADQRVLFADGPVCRAEDEVAGRQTQVLREYIQRQLVFLAELRELCDASELFRR